MHGRKKKDGTRMDNGTGLSNTSVVDGTKRAVEHGYLDEEIDNRDKARIKKSYRLKMRKQEKDDPLNEGEPNEDNPGVDNPEPTSDSEAKPQNGANSGDNFSENQNLGSGMKNPHSQVNNVHSESEESPQRTEKSTPVPSYQKTTITINGFNQDQTNGSVSGKTRKKQGLTSYLIKKLPDIQRPKKKAEYIAQEISRKTKSPESIKWWHLVASKFEETVIWRNLVGLEDDDEIKSRGAVFSARMGQEAAQQTYEAQTKSAK